MAYDWPDGWIVAALKDAGLPITDFTKRGVLAWNHSTPIPAYTNNPLGMPAVKGKTSELMRTGYAMFPTMGDFRKAFAALIVSPAGSPLHDALALDEKYSQVWRAVHALKWPANNTETDWPSALLDLTSESYRTKTQSTASSADRKTSGEIGFATGFGDVAGSVARTAASTATRLQQARNAINLGWGRLT